MDLKTVLLVQVVTLASWLPSTFSYCTWAGANPYWTGTPTVEQVSALYSQAWSREPGVQEMGVS